MTTGKKNHQEKGKLKTYCEVINCLLETYAVENVIAEIETEFINFKQPIGTPAGQYFQALLGNARRSVMGYNKPRLNVIIIEEVHLSIRYSMRI